MERKTYSTNTPWEPKVGYSRAVRVGPFVHVSGSTATDENGHIVAVGNPYGQAVKIIENIRAALEALGAGLEHVVRTRTYVTNMEHWQEVGRAHGEFFGDIRPATSMVEVSALITPDVIVEIEADAIVPDADGPG